MSKPTDDFEAAREISTILEEFNSNERLRIIKWALEKLGEDPSQADFLPDSGSSPESKVSPPSGSISSSTSKVDIKTFVTGKSPKNDVQFATTVAYFYAFEAPSDAIKESIGSSELTEAIRLVNWKRPGSASKVLNNAHILGYLDKTGETGQYKLNSVGENLVAMVLPEQTGAKPKVRRSSKKKKTKKKANKKRASRKNRR